MEFGPERTVNKVSRRLADTSRARDQLGFVAQVGVEEGLARLVEWWLQENELDAQPAVAVAP